MMIRAYRMRGHLHANLDPLGFEKRVSDQELSPSHYGFTEADYDRKIFIDNVLGLEYASVREMLEASIPLQWVAGEISNFKRYDSGHCYFTLKDEAAQAATASSKRPARRYSSASEVVSYSMWLNM